MASSFSACLPEILEVTPSGATTALGGSPTDSASVASATSSGHGRAAPTFSLSPLSGNHGDAAAFSPGALSGTAASSSGHAKATMVWCHERSHKEELTAFRLQLEDAVEGAGARLYCLKKSFGFQRWAQRTKSRVFALLADWREVKPSAEFLIQVGYDKPHVLIVYTDQEKQYKQARRWVSWLPTNGYHRPVYVLPPGCEGQELALRAVQLMRECIVRAGYDIRPEVAQSPQSARADFEASREEEFAQLQVAQSPQSARADFEASREDQFAPLQAMVPQHSHCSRCGLAWWLPEPLNGLCTECGSPVDFDVAEALAFDGSPCIVASGWAEPPADSSPGFLAVEPPFPLYPLVICDGGELAPVLFQLEEVKPSRFSTSIATTCTSTVPQEVGFVAAEGTKWARPVAEVLATIFPLATRLEIQDALLSAEPELYEE